MSVAVVLDTNALLLPFTDGTDIAAEAEGLLGAVRFVVPEPVVTELSTLADGPDAGSGETARAARAALRLLARFEREPSDLPGDDAVLDVAARAGPGAAVLSNDRRLQQEARKRGLLVLASRGRGRLHRLDQGVA